jgi:hypothetical protein
LLCFDLQFAVKSVTTRRDFLAATVAVNKVGAVPEEAPAQSRGSDRDGVGVTFDHGPVSELRRAITAQLICAFQHTRRLTDHRAGPGSSDRQRADRGKGAGNVERVIYTRFQVKSRALQAPLQPLKYLGGLVDRRDSDVGLQSTAGTVDLD